MEKPKNNQAKAKPQKPKLTRKQETFVAEYVRTGNGTQSALKAYDIESKDPVNVANQIAIENLQKPTVVKAIEVERESLKDALLEQGVTPMKIAEKVDELLDAETPIYKNNNATKQVELVGYAPDFNAIDKGLKHATAIFGVEAAGQPKSNNTYNFFFSPELRKEVEGVEAKIKAALLNDIPAS